MAEKQSDSGANLVAALGAKATDGAQRLIELDKWLAGRIEEAKEAETRLAKRLEHMTRAEDGLRAVFDSLRKQVTEAFPLISQLQQFRPAAEAGAAELAKIEHNIGRLVAQAKTETETLLQPLPQQIDLQADRLKILIEQIVDGGTKRVWARMEELENKASAFENWLKAQTDEALREVLARMQEKAEAAEEMWRERLLAQMTGLEERAKVLGEGMQRKLAGFHNSVAELSKQAERIVRQSAQEAQVSAESKARTLGGEIENRFERLRAELLRTSTEFAKQAEELVGEAKVSLRKELEQGSGEWRAATAGFQRQMAEGRASASRQMQQEIEAVKQTVGERLEELRAGGHSIAEQVEEDLMRRLRTIRPQFNRELELAEKLLGERITRLADELQATMELRESQLAAKMEDLRPRATAAWRSIEAEMAAKAAALEHEANTMTGWLERRMTQRIDELVQRSRRVLQRAMGHMDLLTGTPNAAPAAPVAEAAKPAGLEVELFVDGRSKRKVGGDPVAGETEQSASAA